MKKTTGIIIFLSLALLGTNLWWAFTVVDSAITATYQDVAHRDNQEALEQTLAIIPIIVKDNYTKEQLINTASNASYTNFKPFEKDGYIWVGGLGLSFSSSGRLESVRRSWE